MQVLLKYFLIDIKKADATQITRLRKIEKRKCNQIKKKNTHKIVVNRPKSDTIIITYKKNNY